LATAAVGATRDELRAGALAVERLLKDGAPAPEGRFAPFAAFVPVARHRSRHDCVKLPLMAAEKAARA
jgi:NifU-like protein involved in Fe-S cluster formation